MVGGKSKRLIAIVAGFLSLPLAVLGQRYFDQYWDRQIGWWLLAVAAALFMLGFGRFTWGNSKLRMVGTDGPHNPWAYWLLCVGVLSSLVSYSFVGDNRYTLIGVILWQGGLLAFIVSMVGFGTIRAQLSRLELGWRPTELCIAPSTLAVLGITVLGAFLRLWRLAELPAEPGVDLPLVYMSVEKVLDGEWTIFSTYHPGRETLYIYLVAGYFKLFGISYPALRTVGALIGIITIPALYGLGRRLANKQVGLVAAAFLAVSRWHLILSRTGLRYILMPLFCIWLVSSLHQALRSRQRWHWAWVGLILGWGFHTYNAWIIMPALVVSAWFVHCLLHRQWNLEQVTQLLFALAIAALVFVPLARFANDDPQMFSMRVASRITSREVPLPTDLIGTLRQNIVRTAGMFNHTGDGVAWSNVPLKRQLGWISGALFLPGLLYLIFHWRRYFLLLGALVITCLPSTLSIAFPHEVPNAGRASGVVGLTCVVAAVPLVLWGQRFYRLLPPLTKRRKLLAFPLLLIVLGALGAEGWETQVDYFETYRQSILGANYPISTRLVEVIEQYDPSGRVFIKAFPHFYDGNALRNQLRMAGLEWDDELLEMTVDTWDQQHLDGPFVVILHPADGEAIEIMEQKYPHVVTYVHFDNHQRPVFLTLHSDP